MNKKLLIISFCFFLFLGLIGTTTVSAQNFFEEELLGISLTCCLIFIIIPFVIAILSCIWIYKDAEKRGKSGALWVILLIIASLLLSFIGFIVVIIFWLAVRPPIGGHPTQQQGQGRMCPNCGRPIPMDARICPYCGKNFQNFTSTQQITLKYCPHCGVKNKIDAKFCEDCGSQL